MPRLPRRFQESNMFHIMTKGINKEKIFEKNFMKNKIMSIYANQNYD